MSEIQDSSREMARETTPIIREALPATDNRSETSQGTVVPDGKFSMMEFALLHFRESVEKLGEDSLLSGWRRKQSGQTSPNFSNLAYLKGFGDWTWKEQAEMVKWRRSPIQTALLRMENPELNKLALEWFICMMKFMGDYPMSSNQTEMDCALKILRICHKYPELRDEVYCQLCKQTTHNRSMKPKSCIMGWRLFAIVAAYYDCSESFRPYLFKYLETTASDSQRTYSGETAICLQNLHKTFKYGGRKNVPLKEEISALANGCISKGVSFHSGSEREGMLHIKTCSVVRDCIDEICGRLDVVDLVEIEEYAMFLRTRDDGAFSPLRSEEYILDVTAELSRNRRDYDLVYQRTVWYFPFRSSDNLLYNELMYFQCLPDYIDGLLVMTRDGALNKQYEVDMQFLAALLHKASYHVNMPTIRDLEHLLPEIVRALPAYKSQHWLNRIHEEMKAVVKRSPPECMAKFVEVLSQWPLFGSCFFRVKQVLVQPSYGDCILAVNKTGIVFLDHRSHEIFLQYSFGEVLSTRRYRSDSNQNFLDLKLGNLMVQKIVRIETEQGSGISDLIGQYMQVINRHRKRPSDRGVTAPYQSPRDHSC